MKCFQLKKWTFGSLITSAYHHGFHPNLVRVTPTVCTSYPVKMVKIWWGQKIHHFSLKSTLSVCQSLWVHKQQHSWIPTKLGTKHPWCVLIHSCEYELILRPKNFHFFFVLSVCFQLKSVTFGSLITSAYHHGFQPNLVRVTPTMSSSYPVNMSKIWGIKKYHLLWCFHRQSLRSVPLGSLITIMNDHEFQPNLTWSIPTVPSFIPVNMSEIWGFKNFTFVLSYFFTHKNLLSTIFTPCAQIISKFITRMDCPTLWDIDYTHNGRLNEPIFMLPAHQPSK